MINYHILSVDILSLWVYVTLPPSLPASLLSQHTTHSGSCLTWDPSTNWARSSWITSHSAGNAPTRCSHPTKPEPCLYCTCTDCTVPPSLPVLLGIGRLPMLGETPAGEGCALRGAVDHRGILPMRSVQAGRGLSFPGEGVPAVEVHAVVVVPMYSVYVRI